MEFEEDEYFEFEEEEGERPEVALCLLFLLSGFCFGLLELLVALRSVPQGDVSDLLSLALLSGSFFSIIGLGIALCLIALKYFHHYRVPYLPRLFLCFLAMLYLLYRFDGYSSWILAPIGCLLFFSLYRSLNDEKLQRVCIFGFLLFILQPLFLGHSMDLVFTEFHTLFILLVSLIPLWYVAAAIASLNFETFEDSQLWNTGKLFLDLLVVILLLTLNSVFLVRLWGYSTLEYLQTFSIIVQISFIALSIRQLGRLFSLEASAQRLRGVFLYCLLAFLLFNYGASQALPSSQIKQLIGNGMPHTNYFIIRLARLFDRDGDAYSSLFGFGDCNDRDPRVHPAGVDWPQNGRDENCLAGDLQEISHPYFRTQIDITPPEKGEALAKPKTVIMVVIDTLRADAIDYALTENTLTPNLAELASESRTFQRAYAQSNNTLEGYPFLLQLGFRNLPIHNPDWALAKYLREAEIESAAYIQSNIKSWWADGLDEVLFGFDEVMRGVPEKRLIPSVEFSEFAAEKILEREERDRFLLIHFEVLHDFFTQRMEGGRMVHQGLNLSELFQLYKGDQLKKLMWARYNAALKEIDEGVGLIFESVRKLERDSEVLLIVASDHGEEFLDHGGLFHMGSLYEELIRVPLLVYAGGEGAREIHTPVANHEVAPTVLDFFGFKSDFLERFSLLRPEIQQRPVFSYYSINEGKERRFFALIDDSMKLIYNPAFAQVEMYDLENDPGERRSVFQEPRYRQQRQKMLKELDKVMFWMNYGDLEYLRLRDAGRRP